MPDDPAVTPPVQADAVTPPGDGASTPSPVGEPVSNEYRTWLLGQSEELQNDPLLQNFKSMDDLARGYAQTKRWADGRVKVPDENTPAEERDKFFQRLGVPTKPEEYEFTKPPEDTPPVIEPTMLESMKPVFHEFKLTKTQADGIQKKYTELLVDNHKRLVGEYTAKMAQQREVLRERWGNAYEANLELAKRTFANNATPSLAATAEIEGWGNNPDFIELFANLGRATGEDSFRPGSPIQSRTLDGEIKAVEQELIKTQDGDPKYKELVAKRDQLYKQRYPETQ